MNKKVIDKITSLGITLALSSSLGLAACAKKESNYIPMTEVFYDENSEGIDDAFEQKITDSSVQIENITKLEKSIELIKKIKSINFKDFYKDEKIYITKLDVDNLNIDEIEKQYEEYEKLSNEKIDKTDYQKQEQLYNKTKELYESYIKLNTYINNYGYSALYDFGMDLYKAIILDTANFSGNETNVIALINQYKGGEEYVSNATYTSDSGYQAIVDINPNSKLYSLIDKVGKSKKNSNDFHIVLAYDEKEIKKIEDTINFYKECIYTKYEIKENGFLFLKELDQIVSKETNVPKK